MKIRHLTIDNFRGVGSLDWTISHDYIVLVGPADSAKTTILEAIGWVLSPSYRLPITEADFYQGDRQLPILISVSVTDLPPEITRLDRFGGMCRGWFPAERMLRDELDPDSECERALTVELRVDDSFEPVWTVRKAGESMPLRSRDRERLGLFKLDDRFDQHLSWSRGSALTALTSSTDDIPGLLARVHSEARRAVAADPPTDLIDASRDATQRARKFGVDVSDFAPGLSPSGGIGPSTLLLHEGAVPVTNRGLGSRRLLSMTLQGLVRDGSIATIDEVEYGLEPHRLRQLLHKLERSAPREGSSAGQVFLTTHSPVTLGEVSLNEVHVVDRRGTDGRVNVQSAGDAFALDPDTGKGVVRACSEALLGRRVCVGEGRTEVGFLRHLLRYWDREQPTPTAHLGVAIADGGGDKSAQKRALAFDRLEYPVLLLLDSDVGDADLLAQDQPNTVQLVQWEGGCAIEQRVALDLPDALIPGFVELAEKVATQEGARSRIAQCLNVGTTDLDSDPAAWESGLRTSNDQIRQALGQAASQTSNGGWFKSIERGEMLGEFVTRNLGSFSQSAPLHRGIASLKQFVYASA